MSETKDIKNISEIAVLVVDLANLGIAIGKSEKTVMSILGLVLQKTPVLIGEGVEAFKDIDQVVPEFEDLSEDEALELITLVGTKLEIADGEKVKKIVIRSLRVAAEAGLLVKEILA